MARRKVKTISGYTLKEPHITPMAIWLLFVWVGVPILIIGGALDLLLQLTTGICSGLWCFAN
ncbi:hypothetical protein [Hirschia litorea]|uniref:hypothetical protein n=1 Tax=Hirschia litorea TaxID=1199156 RepID=UPI0036D38A57